MPDLNVVLIAGLAVFVGAIVQSGVGLGLGLVAAPVMTLADPSLMPGSTLIVAVSLTTLTLTKEIGDADWPGLRWSLGGRFAGSGIGVWVLVVIPARALSVAIGVMVLVAIGVSLTKVEVPRTQKTLVGAGFLAGITGTSTSIAGPPVALLYQRESGPRIRATLSVFFFVGTLFSLAALGMGGQLSKRSVVAGLLLVPFTIAGFAVSGPLRRFLDQGRMRTGVLLVAAASALLLIVRSLL